MGDGTEEAMRRDSAEANFEMFVATVGPRLRHALVARYGPEGGSEATAEALAYSWEHWERVSAMDNPAGWLYRGGQSRSRRFRRHPVRLPPPQRHRDPLIEPGLAKALAALPDRQRVAVLMVHAFGYTVREAAQTLGVSPSTVQQNANRAITKLRTHLGVTSSV